MIPKRATVFDYRLWTANGGDSKQDSFMRSAWVINRYPESGPYEPKLMLVDVIFDHDHRLSKGHFEQAIEYINKGEKDAAA